MNCTDDAVPANRHNHGADFVSDSSIVDIIECEHNYWCIPNFKPVRYWSK